MKAFGDLDVSCEAVVYADDAIEEIRDQLLGLDGVLVWVNPIQDGTNRAQLDALLREVWSRGVWVSARPDVILGMGTKEVLFRTRDLGWGTDTSLYDSLDDFMQRFPPRLAQSGPRVLKQGRGNGGNGVWKVELIGPPSRSSRAATSDSRVRVQHAQTKDDTTERLLLSEFIERCASYNQNLWIGHLFEGAAYLPR